MCEVENKEQEMKKSCMNCTQVVACKCLKDVDHALRHEIRKCCDTFFQTEYPEGMVDNGDVWYQQQTISNVTNRMNVVEALAEECILYSPAKEDAVVH